MTSVPSDDDEKLAPGRIVAAIIFALLALAFFLITCVYLAASAAKLPGYLGFAQSGGNHSLRGVGTFILGLAFAGASWFALRYRSLAMEEAREADRALAEARARAEATAGQATPGQGSSEQGSSEQATAGQATEA